MSYQENNIALVSLKEIKYAPTGFMLLTRKLCEDMISNYSDLTFQFWRSQKLLNYPLIDVFGTMLYKDPTKFIQKLMDNSCLLYTSPSPRDQRGSRMPSCS